MAKKDTASALLGMLSSAGAQTRLPAEPAGEPAPSPRPPVQEPTADRETAPSRPDAAAVDSVPSSVSPLPTAQNGRTAPEEAPRTLRLRANTALRLRAAWLEAKRDDVLLTAQDFASDLVEEALARRRRARRTASSS